MYITKYGQNYIFAPFEGLRKHSCSATPSAHVATITVQNSGSVGCRGCKVPGLLGKCQFA